MRIIARSAHLLLAYILASGIIESGSFSSAHAQTVPQSLEQGGSDAVMRNRKNNWTVGIAGGQLSGTYMNFANELAEVLDDGGNLRLNPTLTYAAPSHIDHLPYLPPAHN